MLTASCFVGKICGVRLEFSDYYRATRAGLRVLRLNHSPIRDSLDKLREVAKAMPRPGCDWESRPAVSSAPDARGIGTHETFPRRPLARTTCPNTSTLCGGIRGMSVHNGYHLCGTSDIVKMNSHSDGWPPTAVSTGGGTEPVLTIALDGGGNAFLLSPRSGDVWRWNHETGKTILVADSFGGFLHRVAEDWAAYVHDREPRGRFSCEGPPHNPPMQWTELARCRVGR